MRAIPSSVDPIGLLQELGVHVQDERGDELWALCPGHYRRVGRLDNEASWSMNVQTGEHHCFSCGYGGTVWGMIASKFEWRTTEGADKGDTVLDTRRAEKWLNQRAGTSFDVVKMLRSTKESYVKKKERRAMDESRLALFTDPPVEAMEERGLDLESVNHYGVLWSTEYDSWVLPIRDPYTAKPWGWQLKGEAVFRNQPSGVKKSETLFGYRQFEGDVAYLLESPLDVVRLHTVGYVGGLASYGATWTERQLSLICEKADRLVVCLDNDPAGKKAALMLMGYDVRGKRIKDSKDWTRRIDTSFFHYTTDHKDIGEMEASDIVKGLQHARSSVRGARAVLGD